MKTFLLAAVITATLAGTGRADLQRRIDAAPPGATITVSAGIYSGPIVINKSLTLVGHGQPTLQGNGQGKSSTSRRRK